MKIFISSLILILAISISGCSTKNTQGNKNLEGITVTEIQNRIKPNISTKQDIESWLGTPSGIGQDKDGNDEWTYKVTSSGSKTSGAAFIPIVGMFAKSHESSMNMRTLKVTFNKSNIVTKYNLQTDDMKM